MSYTRYRLDPKTLTFEKQELHLGKKMRKAIYYGVVTLVLAVVISGFIISNYETPRMKSLKKENHELRAQYNNLDDKLQTIEQALAQIQKRDDNIYRVMLNSEPIPTSVRKAGFGGASKYTEFEVFRDAEHIVNTARKVDILSKQAYIQAKSYEEVLGLALTREKELASTPAIIPIANHDLNFTSSGWGMRIHPVYKVLRFHYGIDFVAPTGTPVYASADGTVSTVKTLSDGHGRHIIIDHGFGFETLYAHLHRFNVSEGQKVKRGQLIGYVGSTGLSTAPHLHYEVHRNGKAVNPINYFFKDLPHEDYQQILAVSSNVKQSLD
jgi:murein DD-endopeptidase MepM/ murein hydrolase activator NlpD